MGLKYTLNMQYSSWGAKKVKFIDIDLENVYKCAELKPYGENKMAIKFAVICNQFVSIESQFTSPVMGYVIM